MTLTIGRVSSLRPGQGYPKLDGNRVSVQGVLQSTDLNVLRGQRQQLLGMVDNEDEEIVPVIWASDANFDGFYRPVSMAVEQLGVTRSRNLRFAATLERLRDYASPMFEVVVQGVLRTNVQGYVTPTQLAAFAFTNQAGAVGRYLPTASSGSGGPVISNTSDLIEIEVSTKSFALIGTATYRYLGAPSLFYGGSARIEALYGATWIPMVGRSIGALAPGAWRISNGMVRFTMGATNTASATFEVWDPVAAAWESVLLKSMHASNIGIGWSYSSADPPRLEILRNSLERVVVRCSGRIDQDTFSLQRGDRAITWSKKDTDGTTFASGTQIGVKFASVTACTAMAGPNASNVGIRNTSNDANGNRWVFAAPVAVTLDTTNGSLRLTASNFTPTFMIGAELGGSGAPSGYRADQLIDYWMGPVSWRQRVVAP